VAVIDFACGADRDSEHCIGSKIEFHKGLGSEGVNSFGVDFDLSGYTRKPRQIRINAELIGFILAA